MKRTSKQVSPVSVATNRSRPVSLVYVLRPDWVMEACRRPTVSSNVIALMLSEHRIASLSTRLLSSAIELRADRMTHMSHRLMCTARRLARFNGEPCNVTTTIRRCCCCDFYRATHTQRFQTLWSRIRQRISSGNDKIRRHCGVAVILPPIQMSRFTYLPNAYAYFYLMYTHNAI